MTERVASRSLQSLLAPSSVAVVGASPTEGSFGARLLTEVQRSEASPEIHLVNPRHSEIAGRRCRASIADFGDIAGPVDVALLAVPDAALEAELGKCVTAGIPAAVIFGSAAGLATDGATTLRDRLSLIGRQAGMAVCGAGCMGYVNVDHGMRAIGYLEPYPLRPGSTALVTHSGSVFSAMLRAPRAIGWTLAVSSGQELVTSVAEYVDYALDMPGTRQIALVLEAMRDGPRLHTALVRAAEAGVAVVALTVGRSARGRVLVAAHSGALAGGDGAWEALFGSAGVTRVRDLDELVETLELFGAGRRARRTRPVPPVPPGQAGVGPGTVLGLAAGGGIATVHDSGAERALVADIAEELGVPFAALAPETHERLARLLDTGLEVDNPLDVWGTGARTRELFADCLMTLAGDPAVAVLALCVDLVPELDGDDSYPAALLDAHAGTDIPVALLSNLHSAVDPVAASALRNAGIPVLEGTRAGLAALGHLLRLREARHGAPTDALVQRDDDGPLAEAHEGGLADAAHVQRVDERRAYWRARIGSGEPLDATGPLELIAEYGIGVPAAIAVADCESAVVAARSIGFPVVLKIAGPIAHKSDVGGVILGLADATAVAQAYRDLEGRLGPAVVVARQVPPGTELALGLVRDPELGPLVIAGAGGVLVELLADRAVALPPLDEAQAARMLARLRIRPMLDGLRGSAPSDLPSVLRAIVSVSRIAEDLGDVIEALDVNPLRCGPGGALALDALVVARAQVAPGTAGQTPP